MKLYNESELEAYERELINLNALYDLVKIGLAEKVANVSDKIAETDDLDEKARLTEELQNYAEAVSFLKYRIAVTTKYYNQALKEVKEKII